jgi:hypothetical protein
MFARITCLGLDTRTLRVQVPAVADSYLPDVTVSLKAVQSTYKGHAETAPDHQYTADGRHPIAEEGDFALPDEL